MPSRKRRDQTDVGGAVEAGELRARITAVDIADRHEGDIGMGAVDVAGLALQIFTDLLIAGDISARWRRDLQQDDILASLFGIVGQEAAKAFETLAQALGIIQPVHADHDLAAAHAGAQLFIGSPCASSPSAPSVNSSIVDADREGPAMTVRPL